MLCVCFAVIPRGTPRTILEAMATARPIITTDAPGCRETVKDGENGFLVPVKDAKALSDKMLWFVEHPEKIEEMAKRALNTVWKNLRSERSIPI